DIGGAALIEEHHAMLRAILRQFPDGFEVSTSGDGFLIVFKRPPEAVPFSLLLQAKLRDYNQTGSRRLDDRVGIHTGGVGGDATDPLPPERLGLQVDTAARVTSLAGADQILLTRFAFDNARQVLRAEEIVELTE